MRKFTMYIFVFLLFLFSFLSYSLAGGALKKTYEVFVPDKIGIFSIDNPEIVARIISKKEGAQCEVVDIGNAVSEIYSSRLASLSAALDDLLRMVNYNEGRKINSYNAIIGIKVNYFENSGSMGEEDLKEVIGTPVKILCRREVFILESKK
jgi:hypothetical protein